jgi:hypothetical protein
MVTDLSPRPDVTPRPTRRQDVILGAVVAVEALLVLAPVVILGSAISWPTTLGDPAAIALPRLLENEGAVRFGYILYLLYSVLLLPVGIVLARRLIPSPTVAAVAAGFIAVSAALRGIGIVRWLGAALPMAQDWQNADAAGRTAIAASFETLNNYGGTIGEELGVSLMTVGFLIAIVHGARLLPTALRVAGAVVALLAAAPAVELAGFDAGGALVTLSSVAVLLWLLAVAVWLIRAGGRTRRS